MGGYLGFKSLSHVTDYLVTKTAVLQVQLSQVPELTDVVIQEANRFAENAAFGDLYQAVCYGVFAGINFAIAKYAKINLIKNIKN